MTKRYALGNLSTISITPHGGSLTALGQVTKITPPGLKREEIDVTDLSSAAIERLLSIPDWSGIKFTINYDSANTGHAAVLTNANAEPITGSDATWTLTLNDVKITTATIFTFKGQVSGWTPAELDNKQVSAVEVEITVTGAVTVTAAT